MDIPYHRLLSLDEQRTLGVGNPAPLAMAGRVHHDELDALMHVNNVVYFVWFERLRIHVMEHYAIGTIGSADDPRIVIRSGEVRYVEEMLRGEDYVVTTRAVAYRRTSLSLEQVIWADGRIRATFHCVMVLLTPDGSARMRLPDVVKDRLRADGAVAEG